jgi:hypothetical protein
MIHQLFKLKSPSIFIYSRQGSTNLVKAKGQKRDNTFPTW